MAVNPFDIEMPERDFRDDIQLDKHSLHVAAERQPEAVQYWTRKLADLKRDKNLADRKAKQERAKALIRMRRESLALPKDVRPIKDDLVAMVDDDLIVQAMDMAVIDAQHKVDVIDGVVNALDQKKRMIDVESRLFVAGYWARPTEYSANKKQHDNETENLSAYNNGARK